MRLKSLGYGITVSTAGGKSLYPAPSPVTELTGETLKGWTTEREPLSIVLFYANWCGHCQKFVPVYEGQATKNKALVDSKKVRFGAIDCKVQDTCASFDIHQYPTIKVFTSRSDLTKGEQDKGVVLPRGSLGDPINEAIKLILAAKSRKNQINKEYLVALLYEASNKESTVNFISPTTKEEAKWPEAYLAATSADHFYDAFIAVFEGLHSGLFLRVGNDGALLETAWQNAVQYVEFTAKHMPNESLRLRLENLKSSMEKAGKPTSNTKWREFLWDIHQKDADLLGFPGYEKPGTPLETHEFRTLPSCANITCREWSLFHVISQEVAKKKTPSEEFFNVIKSWREYLFACAECRNHMLEHLTSHQNEQRNQEPNMFMFEFHNAVTERVNSGLRSMYPPKEICKSCWDSSNKAVDSEIRTFLENAYSNNSIDYFKGSSNSMSRKLWIFLLLGTFF